MHTISENFDLVASGDESGWCSDVASTHGAWRHAGVRFLLRRGEHPFPYCCKRPRIHNGNGVTHCVCQIFSKLMPAQISLLHRMASLELHALKFSPAMWNFCCALCVLFKYPEANQAQPNCTKGAKPVYFLQ